MAKTIPLSKPLLTHDGELKELKLRELTAADIVSVKVSPFKVTVLPGTPGAAVDDRKTEVEQRYDVLMALAARLTGIDDILLGKLKGSDFQKLTQAVIEEWNASSGE